MKGDRAKYGAQRVSPLGYVVRIALTVFIAEAVIMAFLALGFIKDPMLHIFVDSITLMLIISPGIYYFVYLPQKKESDLWLEAQKNMYEQDAKTKERITEGLKEKERFLSDILDSIQNGVSILDKDMNILRVNPTMGRWYSHQMPLVGKKCYEAYHGRKEPCDICPSIKTLQTGRPAFEVVPYIGAEGIKGWLEVFTSPLTDSDTLQTTGVIEYVKDITDRRLAEAEVNTRIAELEKFYEMAVGRELKMKELKRDNDRLREEIERIKQNNFAKGQINLK